jgi:hypothetical protein
MKRWAHQEDSATIADIAAMMLGTTQEGGAGGRLPDMELDRTCRMSIAYAAISEARTSMKNIVMGHALNSFGRRWASAENEMISAINFTCFRPS